MSLLDDYVTRFNEGIRSGDFTSMLEQFTDDAEMEFVGIPVGPFRGHDAIAAAYRERPPDDEIVLLEQHDGVGVYAWRARPALRAGELHLTERDGRIARLVIVYEHVTNLRDVARAPS
jgi:steroid Delta-isomerase